MVKIQMAEVLEQCYSALDMYGKDIGSFPNVVKLFEYKLADLPAAEIIPAFDKYLEYRTSFPAPATIIGIIKGRVKRNDALYRHLRQKLKNAEYLTPNESEWLKKCEQQMLEDFE